MLIIQKKHLPLQRFHHAVPSIKGRSGEEEGGALHIKQVFANALFLVALNLENSKVYYKNIAEVDATGRLNMLPVSVQRLM